MTRANARPAPAEPRVSRLFNQIDPADVVALPTNPHPSRIRSREIRSQTLGPTTYDVAFRAERVNFVFM